MWHDLLVAVCLVLVIEGVLPFISPGYWREMIQVASQLDTRSIRIMGLVSMLLGTALLYLVN